MNNKARLGNSQLAILRCKHSAAHMSMLTLHPVPIVPAVVLPLGNLDDSQHT